MAQRFPKFLIGEIDGIEQPGPVEYEPIADDVYVDEGKTETVKGNIDNVAQGYSTFFKYELDRDFTIPALRSKIITSEINISSYCLTVEGILEIT